jgi:hypothetical protein
MVGIPPVPPLEPPLGPMLIVELGSGYGGDTVGLDNGVCVSPVPESGSVPLDADIVPVETGYELEFVIVKGAGLIVKG